MPFSLSIRDVISYQDLLKPFSGKQIRRVYKSGNQHVLVTFLDDTFLLIRSLSAIWTSSSLLEELNQFRKGSKAVRVVHRVVQEVNEFTFLYEDDDSVVITFQTLGEIDIFSGPICESVGYI
jgi:hypothetical protein